MVLSRDYICILLVFRLSESGLNSLIKMFGESARSVVKRSKMRT